MYTYIQTPFIKRKMTVEEAYFFSTSLNFNFAPLGGKLELKEVEKVALKICHLNSQFSFNEMCLNIYKLEEYRKKNLLC